MYHPCLLSAENLYSGFHSTVYENGFYTKKKESAAKTAWPIELDLKRFLIGKTTIVNAMENENLEQQSNGQDKDFERFFDSSSQNQVIEN